MPKRRDQSQHDSMVSNLAAYLQKSGYENICADISGYPQPKGIHWLNKPQSSFIPDATATKNGQFFIFEVETSDSIADEHIKV